MEQRVVAVRMMPELIEAVDAAACERGTSRSELIRHALSAMVDMNAVEAGRRRRVAAEVVARLERDRLRLARLLARPR